MESDCVLVLSAEFDEVAESSRIFSLGGFVITMCWLRVEKILIQMAECLASPLCMKLQMQRSYVKEKGFVPRSSRLKKVQRYTAGV